MTPTIGTEAICRCGDPIRWTGRWGWGHTFARRRGRHRAQPKGGAA